MHLQNDNLVIRSAVAADAAILGKWWRGGKVMAHAGFPDGLSITDGEIAEQILTDTDDAGRRLIIEIHSVLLVR